MQADGLTLQLLKPLDGFPDVVIGDRRMPPRSSSSSNMPATMASVAPIG